MHGRCKCIHKIRPKNNQKFSKKFVVKTKGINIETEEQPNTDGESSTKVRYELIFKSYLKQITDYHVYGSGNAKIFCIDTPGIHDTGGIEVDQRNSDQLAAYINQATFQ